MKPKTTRLESAQARRQLIVEAAAACFIEQGFHQTSIRDIAKRAGVSLGNLYNHFENKAALIAEIAMLEELDLAALEERVIEISDPSDAFDKFVALYLEYCCIPENILLAAEITSEGLRNREIGAGFLQNQAKLNSVISKLIADVAAQRSVKPAVKPSVSADFVVDLIQGLAMRSAFENTRPSKAELAALNTAIARLAID